MMIQNKEYLTTTEENQFEAWVQEIIEETRNSYDPCPSHLIYISLSDYVIHYHNRDKPLTKSLMRRKISHLVR